MFGQYIYLEPPTWRIVHSIRLVQFILVWKWNPPYIEQLLRLIFVCLEMQPSSQQILLRFKFFELFTFLFNLLVLYKWQCWYQVRPKQWRTVGVAETSYNFIFLRDICELTSCPRAEQIPCICNKLMGHWPCLIVVCLWYVSGIVSLSLHLSSWMGIFTLVLVMSFHNQDQNLMLKYLLQICS